MSHSSRAIFLFLTIVAVVLVSAVGTTSVYADDGTPPPSPTETVVVDPSTGGETEPAVEPPAEEGEPVATEPAVTEPAVTEPAATEAPVEPAPTEAPVVEEPVVEEPAEDVTILEQVPDDTTLTVLNAEGEVQPLTTPESVAAVLTGDPIWCPAGAAPGDLTCTEEFSSLSDLLAYLDEHEADLAADGTIYVEMGDYLGGESSIDFNNYEFDTLKTYALTVQGGWNTADNTYTATTNFNVPLTIGSTGNPWAGSLTVNNIVITGVSNQTGLTLVSNSSVNLDTVSVTNSLGGADLSALNDGSQVNVLNSNFNNNEKFGARIKAGGRVNIQNTHFDDNTSHKYDGSGLEIDNTGDVSLVSIWAERNETFGADINATGAVSIANSFFNNNIAYTNCGTSYKSTKCSGCKEVPNGGYGLKVVALGYGYLNGVEANDNWLYGAHVEAGGVSPYLGTFVYNSKFNSNGSDSLSNPKGYGLEVLSQGGITLNNVQANDNQLFGANLVAGLDTALSPDVTNVAIQNSFFDGNKSYKCSCDGTSYYGYGLQVKTTGNIALSAVSASKNYLWGAHLEGRDVAVTGAFVDGAYTSLFNNNGNGTKTLTGEGLKIVSTGNVTLANTEANNNQKFGADIQALSANPDAGRVNIASSFFNGQKFTYSSSCKGTTTTGGYGIRVEASNFIAISGIQANDNYLYGAHLTGAGVAITNGFADDPSLNSSFNNNQEGLKIQSTAAVSLENVEANSNKLFGADITVTNSDPDVLDTVSINTGFFNGNGSYTYSSCKGKKYTGYGLRVVTTGAVNLSVVEANDNYDYGAHLEGAKGMNISGSSFSSNGTDTLSDHIGRGLEIVSTGTQQVNLYDVTADGNQLFGAYIHAEGNVFVGNGSSFSGNISYTGTTCGCKTYDGYGIKVISTAGSVTFDEVTAEKNYLFGAHVEGTYVRITLSDFNLNVSPLQSGKTPTGRGLEVISTGDVLLRDVNANNNQLFGADVKAGGSVEVLSSAFNDNKYTYYSSCKGTKSAGYGLKVVTTNAADGVITLNSVDANGNGAEGAILQSPSDVNVTTSVFNNNGANGLSITASGAVNLIGVTANGNKGNGVEVKGICTNTVTIQDGEFGVLEGNSKYGIKIVDAQYILQGTQQYGNNGYGNFFQSGCVTTTNTVSSQPASTNNPSQSGQGNWYWYWYAHKYGRHHH